MEISVTTGACCFRRPVIVSGPALPEQLGMTVAPLAAAGSPGIAASRRRAVYHARFRTLNNLSGIDLPVNPRLCASASEP